MVWKSPQCGLFFNAILSAISKAAALCTELKPQEWAQLPENRLSWQAEDGGRRGVTV